MVGAEGRMRDYWDDAARRNAAWYVDTSLDYDHPDMQRFLDNGGQVVADALDRSPVPLAGNGLAVEIGPGLGRVCKVLAKQFDRVVGIDVSPEMVARAQSMVDAPNVTFEVGDGATLGTVADSSADLVLSFTVLQHIPSVRVIESYLAEAGRVLRPGGLLVFQWNNTPGGYRWQMRRVVLGLLQRTGLHAERYRRHAPEFLGSRVPLRRIRAALERGNLELVATESTGTLFAWAWAVRR